jgi:hypothetical protein
MPGEDPAIKQTHKTSDVHFITLLLFSAEAIQVLKLSD